MPSRGALLGAQQANRPMSPDGSAQAQVLGKWTKGSGRRLRSAGSRTRAANGSRSPMAVLASADATVRIGRGYGKAANRLGHRVPAAAGVARRRERDDAAEDRGALTFGDKTVPAGEYSLFIDLKGPRLDADRLELAGAARSSTRKTRRRCGAHTATRRTRTSPGSR